MKKAKVLSENRGEGAKIGEAADVQPSLASNRNEQPVEEVPTLAVRHSTPPATFAEYIEDELKARGWSRDHLASQMTAYDWGLNRFVIDFMLVDPMPDGAILGDETALRLAHAFGTSKEFWLNLWESCHPRKSNTEAVTP